MSVGDIWEYVTDALESGKDAIVETFEGIGEVSTYGLIFGAIAVGIILLTSKWMLGSFTSFMKPASRILVTILTYAITFVVGYFIGKRFEDTA